MGEWSDYMKENEMLEYVNNTRDKLSEELYNFYEKQKQELFDYINNPRESTSRKKNGYAFRSWNYRICRQKKKKSARQK